MTKNSLYPHNLKSYLAPVSAVGRGLGLEIVVLLVVLEAVVTVVMTSVDLLEVKSS